MPKYVLIDQLHVEIRAPIGLPEREVRAIRKTLLKKRFRRELREHIRDLLAKLGVPDVLQVEVTR